MRSFLILVGLAGWLMAETPDPAQWEYRRKVAVHSPGVLHLVRIGPKTLAHAQPNLGDVRVMWQDAALPYAIETLSGSVEEQRFAARLTDKVKTAEGSVRFTLRAPEATRHSRVRIETAERGFRRKVKLESSDDGKAWDTVLDDGYVMVHEQDGSVWEALEVDYPASTRPYLRVTIADWPDVKTLGGAALLLRTVRAPLRQTVKEFTPAVEKGENAKESLLRMEFGEKPAPWSSVRVETAAKAFHRPARVSVSDDGKLWRTACSGVLFRIGKSETMTLDCGEQRARHARLHIYNRDDEPLAVTKVEFEALVRMVRFIPREEGEHSLWYGNPKAKPVSYDLAIVLDRNAPIERIVLIPGPERRYGDFLGEIKPWTEKNPVVLYTAVFAAAALIAAFTLRAMKKIAAKEQKGS
ncbi:MAG: DUF3999 family protein [Acidobacteria bacterium]|nr:DUF3999 family protein [Acidobacteriota bacterium]